MPDTSPAPVPAPSYDHGASSTKLIGETIGALFDRTVARHPARDGVQCARAPRRATRVQRARSMWRAMT